MRGIAQRADRQEQTQRRNSKFTGPKFTNFLSDRRIICDVNARNHVAILPSVVECQRKE